MTGVRDHGSGFPRTVRISIRLDDDPGYRGSVHDDAVARRMGFRAALVPGAFVYGHVSRIAIEAWGIDWSRHGRMEARFRRPVYDGDVLTAAASALVNTGSEHRATVTLRNQDGEEVAAGWIAMPGKPPRSPPVEDCPVLPLPDPPPAIAPGGMTVGTRLGSRDAVLTWEEFRRSLAAFDERHPLYLDGGLVHSGCLIRRTMADANRSFRFPAPVVFVSGEAQHFAPVSPGQRLATSGTVTAVYERKGRHYFETEEFLVVDGARVAARFRRTSIYA
ncbi:MaoC family dehydratase [Inquilinus limosus]|uniref:MaoC family dehydratase n=1 Tax=Inquilinus limosus TaxID=171674 RepID=UPI003F176C13